MSTVLVVVDTKKMRYSRFCGRTCMNIVDSMEGPLAPELVELFRVDPTKLYPEDPSAA